MPSAAIAWGRIPNPRRRLGSKGATVSESMTVIALGLLAGGTIPLGGAVAACEDWLGREGRRYVVAFGGGALLAAVSLVLVPDGMRSLAPAGAGVAMIAGGASFLALDLAIHRYGGSGGSYWRCWRISCRKPWSWRRCSGPVVRVRCCWRGKWRSRTGPKGVTPFATSARAWRRRGTGC